MSGGKYLFYGVTLKSEFDSVSPWFSHREMEENMAEEAETSGDLYLKSGIVESSRYTLSLANQYYSETFNYVKLADVYKRLAIVVASQVPIIDVSNQLELSSQIGRFYKVYFHGGAPDDLLHSQVRDSDLAMPKHGIHPDFFLTDTTIAALTLSRDQKVLSIECRPVSKLRIFLHASKMHYVLSCQPKL